MDREFFESYYETYNQEDPETLAEFYHEDVLIRSSQMEQTGKEAILGMYRYIISVLKDQMTPTNIIVQGEQAAVEIHDRFEAKQDIDDFLGRRLAKGDTFELHLCGIYRVENRKIREISIYQR